MTLQASGLYAAQKLKPSEIVLVLPPKYVLTVQEALGSGAGRYINKHARKLPRTLPNHFVLAMWVLYHKYMVRAPETKPSPALSSIPRRVQVSSHKRGLWSLWLDALPPLDAAPVFWDDDQLHMLEEERAITRSRARRVKLEAEFESMVQATMCRTRATMGTPYEPGYPI